MAAFVIISCLAKRGSVCYNKLSREAWQRLLLISGRAYLKIHFPNLQAPYLTHNDFHLMLRAFFHHRNLLHFSTVQPDFFHAL